MRVPPIRMLKEAEAPLAVLLGIFIAAAAVALRLAVSIETGGDQAIFAYPAIIIATLLVGARAGIMTMIICMLALWYYVIPDRHSFHLPNARAAITLLIYVLVGCALIWAIGAMRGALFQVQDLAAHLEHRVEERTAERNRFWELSRELVAIVDEDGRLVSANPSLQSHLPRSGPATFADLITAEDQAVFVDARSSLQRDGRGVGFDARIRGGEAGLRRIAWSMVSDGSLIYLVGRDFTSEHDCAQQLVQSHKMELVGQVAGGLAHDFGNVLSSINVALHMIRSQGTANPRIGELVGMAEQGSALGEALIVRLLSLSRPSDGDPEIVPLRTLIDDVVPLLRQSVDQRELALVIADDLPAVRVDRSQFAMALLNLGINARDATRKGDLLTLIVENGDDGTVRVVMADNGVGMNGDTLRRVTEPFFTTKDLGLGTGLGLSMVHRFAEAAGGRFLIDSAPGEGTSAGMRLPIADDTCRPKMENGVGIDAGRVSAPRSSRTTASR